MPAVLIFPFPCFCFPGIGINDDWGDEDNGDYDIINSVESFSWAKGWAKYFLHVISIKSDNNPIN